MPVNRVYRRPIAELYLGIFEVIVFEFLAFPSQAHLITGAPLIVQKGPHTYYTHVASSSELWLAVLGLGFFQLLGIYFILRWLNISVRTDENGVTATNLFRLVTFRSSWPEITAVARRKSYAAGGEVYTVFKGSEKLEFDDHLPFSDELKNRIEGYVRTVDLTPWR